MSEKLSAFAALYAEKAAADVEKQKENVAKSEEKLKRATELWEALKIETEKLGIFEKFTSVFPQPGGGVVATDGVSANPNLTTLLSYGDPLESSVRELLKLKNAKERLDNTKTALAYAEGLVARKPEDHINMLGHELVKLAAKSASGGGNTIDSLLKSFFSTYESFKEIMEYEINDVSGPKTVDTSQESYAVLNEKFEAGELFKSEKKEDTASPIKSLLSSAAFLPISGFPPAPNPLVNFAPILQVFGANDLDKACASVFIDQNSTPSTPPTILFTAFPPPPPTPITFMTHGEFPPSG